jgi:hypothetical protein
MIAAIIFCGLSGIVLVARRKDVFTVSLGIVLLAITVWLFIDHWEWLHE